MSGEPPRSDAPALGAPESAPPASPPPQSSAKASTTPLEESRRGFRTMPHELRAFHVPGEGPRKLEDMPGLADAAAKLREKGRGGDVLWEDLRDAAPPERAEDRAAEEGDSRAEHVIVSVPAVDARGVAKSAGVKKKESAEKQATGKSDQERPGAAPRVASNERPRDRRWLAVLAGAALLAVVVFFLMRGTKETPGASSGTSTTSSGASTTSSSATTTTGAATNTHLAPHATATNAAPMGTLVMVVSTAASAEPSATGAPSTTSAVPSASTGGTSSGKTASPHTTADPYLDAGAVPKSPATAEPTSAPAVTTMPSVIPSTTPTGRDPLQPVIKF